MNLKFIESFSGFESIQQSFTISTFKDLNVITGINGSGKTQFLKAIKEGHIQVDDINPKGISYFNSSNFYLQDCPLGGEIIQKSEILKFINTKKNELISYDNQIKQCLNTERKYFYTAQGKNDIQEGKSADYNQIKKAINELFFLEVLEKDNSYKETYKKLWSKLLYYTIKPLSEVSTFDDLIETKGIRLTSEEKELVTITQKILISNSNLKEECEEFNLPRFGASEGSMFMSPTGTGFYIGRHNTYYNSWINNGDQTYKCSGLSSGEKVLLTIFIRQQQTTQQQLLLFDEVDATLHPSICKKFIEKIKLFNVKMIFATHNPFTVKEFLDDDSIGAFILKKDAQGGHIIENVKASNKFFSWSPSFGETMWKAYETPTIELHNELYGYFESKKDGKQRQFWSDEVNKHCGACRCNCEEDYPSRHSCKKCTHGYKKYWNDHDKKKKYEFVSLHKYIRHRIHHHGNRHNSNYSEEELKISIKEMIEAL